MRLLLLFSLLLFPTGLSAEPGRPAMKIEKTSEGCWIKEGERRVLFYQRTTRSLDGKYARANYVHPLMDLDGNEITEDFPADHPHHRGVFWAWHQCLVGSSRAGDGWACQDFNWQVDQVRQQQKRNWAALHVRVTWSSPAISDDNGQPVPLVAERTTIRVPRAGPQMQVIDFDIELNALVPELKLGGSNDAKGYGGFSPRFTMPADVEFLAQSGQVKPATTAVEGGGWMHLRGDFGGRGSESGITIMCHPSVPGFPQAWILRRSGSMQNAVYPGAEAVPLEIGSPWRFRYRLLLHRGPVDAAQIEQHYQEYSRSDTARTGWPVH
jgi:hypothetical protein